MCNSVTKFIFLLGHYTLPTAFRENGLAADDDRPTLRNTYVCGGWRLAKLLQQCPEALCVYLLIHLLTYLLTYLLT